MRSRQFDWPRHVPAWSALILSSPGIRYKEIAEHDSETT
jgi:hypothetical protein